MADSLFPVVILAGGLATRLRPITATIPKALIPIHAEPFISHQLRLLHRNGIRKVVLCVGYLGEMIQDELGDGHQFGMQVEYCFDGPTLLGTGGAIKQALPLLADNFFVLYGDSYLDCDYAAVQKTFLAQQKVGLMTVFHNAGQWDMSNIEYADQQILAYDKIQRTERMHYIDYGLGIFNRVAFDHYVPAQQASDLAQLYQTLLREQQLAAHEVQQRFYEVGSFAGINELEYYLVPDKLTVPSDTIT